MEKQNKEYNGFKDFFSKWLFGGVIIILISIIWKSFIGNDDNSVFYFIQSVSISLLSTLGISVFLGSIFNWIIGTQSFSDYVKSKIVNVLISRDYIGDLDLEKKESMLKAIMKPNKLISNIYSRINDYFELYVKRSMLLFKEQQFRSELALNGKVVYGEDNLVCVKYRFSYRTYVVDSEHENLRLGFNDDKSRVVSTKVALPDKNFENLSSDEVPKKNVPGFLGQDCVTKKVFESVLPNDEYRKAKYLNVIREIEEYGESHWINYSYRSSKPTDGMTMTLECENDLIIKDVVPYGPINGFDIKISDDKKNVSIIRSGWMDPGYGVNVLIAKEN